MTKQLDKEIQILINKYKLGNFTDVLDKCLLLVKKYPKNDFMESSWFKFSKNR